MVKKFHKVFHKRLVKTTVKEVFFLPILMFYCEGCHFSSGTLEIGKADKILDPEINFKILY